VVAAWLPAARFVDVSCSGAETADLRRPQQGFGPAARRSCSGDRGPTLVTIGMGGNDFGLFGTLSADAPRWRPVDPNGSPCRQASPRPTGPTRCRRGCPEIEARLVDALRAVRERAPDAVVAVSATRGSSRSGSCADLPLAAGDYRWADRVQRG
jgi:hypothetical protein